MSAKRVAEFAALRADVAAAMRVGRATTTMVDRCGRPRSRVLIAVWELDGERPVGWLATFRTPVKVAHIAHNPHVAMSYRGPTRDTVTLDTVAAWVDDSAVKAGVGELHRRGSPAGVGYHPRARSGPQARAGWTPTCCGSTRGGSGCCAAATSPPGCPPGSGGPSPGLRPAERRP